MTQNAIKRASGTLPAASTLSSSQATRFSPAFRGRRRSVILDGENPSENVIINSNLLKLHKKASATPHSKIDDQKSMSDQEFAWWSDPFLRMLSSPLRMCVLTKRYAPKDHLIRMTATLLTQPDVPPSSSTPLYLMPSDLHHPRYASRPEGLGAYIACSKKAIPLLSGKGRHRSIFPGAEVHELLEEQITSGLQSRCVEEAELLGSRLRSGTRYKPGEPAAFTVRRLTLEEYELVLQQSAIRDPKAVAVIVVPKGDEAPEALPEASPKSQLLLRGSPPTHTGLDSETVLPIPRIPIYWAASIFQDLRVRASLRKALDLALSAERSALRSVRKSRSVKARGMHDIPYEPKARNAYALCASRRVDAVPLAIAFWRLRLWEGANSI